MSVQDHIENILNAQGKIAIDFWSAAIIEHPQAAEKILVAVGDHLVENSSWL